METLARYDKLGPNEVPFKPETIWVSIAEELFTLFKVYQFLIYSVWFWFAYLFVTAVLVAIVLIAAAIAIVNRRRSQFAIAKVCFATLMPLRKDNSCLSFSHLGVKN